ncbi:hypothetical protein LMH87_010958 [Akanthomyces muscarius]|uniref:Uncharacterized protein n=1 Tax=Akanthomyces muscarius TaxID=2231603 RepID=A0A9W8Q9P5_AKAMU|nr:hypothetical protein LMH87_010958 [Akanthomyces muscarius]KAJ4150196.1 hypothetical protein LMH87_010958 [Akanthomyces muscarius]
MRIEAALLWYSRPSWTGKIYCGAKFPSVQPLHPAAVQRMQLSEPWPLEQRAAMHISAADFSARDVSA